MKVENLPDDTFIEDILSGNPERRNAAFRQLYLDKVIWLKVLDFAKLYQIQEADAEDILQEAFILLDRTILEGKFRGESSVKTFLLAICRNLMRGKYKTPRRVELYDEPDSIKMENDDQADHKLSFEEKTQEENLRDRILHRLLDQLRENCRQILGQYYFQEWTMAQIAEQMNLANAHQAKKAAFRCRQYLRELIEKEPGLANFLKQSL